MEFVSFETSKKLKEKCFKEQCLAYYSPDSDFYYNASCGGDVQDAFKSFNSHPNLICGKRVDVPTISKVLKWLRKEKEIDIAINPIIKYDDNLNRIREYNCDIFAPRWNKPYCTDYYDSYEQAAMVGIKFVLDNLI